MVDLKAETTLTGADLLQMPHGMGERYELIEGKLITMAPASFKHGLVAAQVIHVLMVSNADHKSGRVCSSETGFYTRGDDKTVRAPDAAFISYARLPTGPLPEGFLKTAPDLVVEVISPGDRAGEIEQKTQEWLDFGVRVVWVIYPDSQRVHIHTRAGSHVISAEAPLDGGDVLPGFSIRVSDLFQE